MARTPEQNNAIITGNIPRQLLLFFFPIWLGTMFQQLYNTVDTLIVGNFVGTQALAAVGATSSFVQLLVGLFVGLCSGAGVIIAQSFGAGDHDEVNRQVHTALALAIAGGAAIATVASQVVSAVLTVRCIHGSQGMPWHLQLKNIRIERSVLLAICRIGLPGAAQSALYSISNMTIQSAINGFGTVAVAAWSVYGKIDFLFWMTVSSFGIAVTTFAGQNFGARQYDRVRRGTMTCLAMTAGTTLCISLALYPSAQLLFRLFSSDDAVVAQGVQMMHYLVPVYMTYICIEIFSGALRGCGDVRVPTIITVFAVCIMRIVWLAVALPFKHEISVVEFSYPLTWITATVLFAIYYAKGGWMQRCIAAQNAKTQG